MTLLKWLLKQIIIYINNVIRRVIGNSDFTLGLINLIVVNYNKPLPRINTILDLWNLTLCIRKRGRLIIIMVRLDTL